MKIGCYDIHSYHNNPMLSSAFFTITQNPPDPNTRSAKSSDSAGNTSSNNTPFISASSSSIYRNIHEVNCKRVDTDNKRDINIPYPGCVYIPGLSCGPPSNYTRRGW